MARYAWEYGRGYDGGYAPRRGARPGRYGAPYFRGRGPGADRFDEWHGREMQEWPAGRSMRSGGYGDHELRREYRQRDPGGWPRDGGGGPNRWDGPGYARSGWDAGGGPGWRTPGEMRPATGDVDTVRAAEIMTRNPEAVTPETPVLEVARRMRDLDVGVMPIVDDVDSFRLRGVVTDRDIAVRAAAEGKDVKKTAVREIMTEKPETVGESDHVRDVFAVMKRARVRRVPVTDTDGRLVGIIAQADLAVNYAGLDLQRETEVEEVIERISEPARPRWGRDGAPADDRARVLRRFARDIESDLPGRVRSGWRTLRREARHLMGRGYDRGWG